MNIKAEQENKSCELNSVLSPDLIQCLKYEDFKLVSIGDGEQIDIDSIKWIDSVDNICPQCGQDHSYKITAGPTMLDMISLFDRDYI
jgi:hypothetical protein